MPRRRSKSGRSSNADVKDSLRPVKSTKEDVVTTGNSDDTEHSSGKDGNDSDEEEMQLRHATEPLESTIDSVECKNSETQSKAQEISNASSSTITLETSCSIEESRCNSAIRSKVKLDDNTNTPSRPNSLVSRGKLVFENRQGSVETVDKWIKNTNESEGNICLPQQDKHSIESLKVNEKSKAVSLENNRYKNILNTEERVDSCRGNRQEEEQPEIEQQLQKMTSTVDIPPEGTDDATRSTSITDVWNTIHRRRQRRLKRSKDRGDEKQNDNREQSEDGNDFDFSTEDEEVLKSHTKAEENQCAPSSSRPTTGYKLKRELSSDLSSDKTSSATSNEKNADNEYDTKVSVCEIKRRLSCQAEKSNESFKLRTSSVAAEADVTNADDCAQCGRDQVSSNSGQGPCTTELYVASVAGKESSSASFLSAAESSSGIIIDEKTVKYKPKSMHAGWTNDADKTPHIEEEVSSEFVCTDSNKVSVKQLKERLISSCSDISDKAIEGKRSDDGKSLVKNISNDESLDNLHKGCAKEELGISIKERLETYRCQASKAYHNIQSFYIEQELPAVTSIKELKSSFNKMVQPSVTPIGPVNTSKVKHINEDLAQMQTYSMKCKSCGKQVFFMERIMAEKATWHKKCFRCKECQKQLTVENYKSQDGELYCQSHYMNILKPKPTDDTVSANSVIEEIKIPPLNLKPLFESNPNSSQSPSPPSSPPSVEKSPTFLKRLAKFQGNYRGESEDEDDGISSSDDTQTSSPKTNSKSEETETHLQEEMKTSESIKMNTSSSSVFMNSTSLDNILQNNEVRGSALAHQSAENVTSRERKQTILCNRNNVIVHGSSIKVRPKSLERRPTLKSRPAEIDLELTLLSNVSVRNMKEQFISSCNNDTPRIEPQSSKERALLKNNSDGCFESHSRSCEDINSNVSLKERLGSYECQTTKEYSNTQSYENTQLSVSSIKELQLTFNKLSYTNMKNTYNGNISTNKNPKKFTKPKLAVSTNCKSCGKEVFFMERMTAEKAFWHKKCFKCKVCQKQLTLNNYKSQNGELYCQIHYAESLKFKSNIADYSVTTENEMNILSNVKSSLEKESNFSAGISILSNSTETPQSPNIVMKLQESHNQNDDEEINIYSKWKPLRKIYYLDRHRDEESKMNNVMKVFDEEKGNSPHTSSKSSTSDFNVQQLLESSLNDYDYISTMNDQSSNDCGITRDITVPSMMVR